MSTSHQRSGLAGVLLHMGNLQQGWEERRTAMKLKDAITKADKIVVGMMTSDATHFEFRTTKAEARRKLERFLEYHVPGTTEDAEDIWNEKISCGAFLCSFDREKGESSLNIRLG